MRGLHTAILKSFRLNSLVSVQRAAGYSLLWLIICLTLVISATQTAYPAGLAEASRIEVANTLYRKAIEDARADHIEAALKVLKSLVEDFPARQDILGDYAIVLGWGNDDVAALALLDKIDRANAPPYVIEGLANSARHLQRYDLAAALYREALVRAPDRVESQIGLMHVLLDTNQSEAAKVIAENLRIRFPQRTDVLAAYAEAATTKRDYFTALESYQSILTRDPVNRVALRGKIQTLSRLGASQLALELAEKNPGVLVPSEYEAIRADRTAHQIRWGGIAADTGRGTSRFAGLDLALADSETTGVRALDRANELSSSERQFALDRVSALRERYRMRDAIALYEALAARATPVPAYTKSAAASAYLYLEQPEKARDLYRAALAVNPDDLESRIGLFYALAESEDHKAALEQIDRTVASTPQWIDAWSLATRHENPAYARVLAARGMAPLLANRPGETSQRLHELADLAPYNMDVRADYASSMRARGWPRRATQELDWILAADPDNSGALGERAGALLEMRDYRNAESALATAQAVAAEDGRVVRAARLWQVHNMRELIVDASFGRAGTGPTGTQEHDIETHLYSSPFDYNYRLFAHTYNAEAKFTNGTGRRNRAGVGVEYRSSFITASGELSHGINDGETAAAASLALTPDDHWSFRGALDTSANETPLQARLANINARLVSAEVVWQAHESRSAALSHTHMDFSDSNRRDITQARWTERVIAGPVYKLEITGGLYASRNSLAGTTYFNPSRDFSPTVEFANEWLQWRRYTRVFRHRLMASAGNYWQQGFGTGMVYDAHYEQEWAADERVTFRYGVGRSLHPYDGLKTANNYGYFSLNWRF